jgi:hypothetical protein
MAKEQKLSVRVPERLLPGVYANQMIIRHTREEFLIDFLNRFPPEGVVAARVIVSPGHLKRMIRALKENLGRYEASRGPIAERKGPSPRSTARSEDAPPDSDAPSPAPAAPSPQRATVAPTERKLAAKVPESVVAGVYANQMMVSHSPDEFLIDFINIFPPEGVVTARVFVSPAQLKRAIRALQDNLDRYEAAHGTIIEASVPRHDSYLN